MRHKKRKPPIFRILSILAGLILVVYLAWEYALLDFAVFDYYQDVEQMADPNADLPPGY